MALVVQRRSGLRAPGPRWPLTGHHPGQHAAAHADTQGQGKLRLDARGRLRGKGLDELRGALRFRATRDNRGDNTAFPAFALAVDKIKTFTMNTFTLPFFAAPNTSTATSCAKSLPSFAAPKTYSATSCAKSFTCVFFGVGSELAGDDGKDKHLPARPPPSTRELGVSPMGSAGAACVCWACLKIGRNCVFEMTNCHFSGPTATLTRTMVYTARCLQVTPRHSLPPSHTATTPFLRLLMICREITSRGHVLVSINFMSWYNGIVSSNSS